VSVYPTVFGKPLLYIYISPVFYFYFIYKSQIELKEEEEDILVVSSQIGTALFFSPFFFAFYYVAVFILMARIENGEKRKKNKIEECVCVCVGRKEMTPLIIYDQTFFGVFFFFFFFLSFLLMSLCVCVCVRRSRPKGNKTFHLATRYSNVPRHDM
jgi:hypothetical protein